MEHDKGVRDRLIALVCIGTLFVNYPLLSLFSRTGPVLGIPLTYFYLFVGWAVFIGSVGIVMWRARLRPRHDGSHRGIDDAP
jgi:hypothetical protein